MKRVLPALILVLVFGYTLQAKDNREYPITLRVGDAYETKVALQASSLSQRCTTNCYSGELECRSTDARNFQAAEDPEGNTYELRCEADLFHNACPLGPGSYEARRDKQAFKLRVPGENRERTLVILNSRPKASDDTGAPATGINRARTAPLLSVVYSGKDEVGMRFADELRRHVRTSEQFRIGDSDTKGWVVKVVSEPIVPATSPTSVVSLVAYFMAENGAQSPILHSVHVADISNYEQAAGVAFKEVNEKIKKSPPCRLGLVTKTRQAHTSCPGEQ